MTPLNEARLGWILLPWGILLIVLGLAKCALGCASATPLASWHPDTNPADCLAYCGAVADAGCQLNVARCAERCTAVQVSGLTDLHPEALPTTKPQAARAGFPCP